MNIKNPERSQPNVLNKKSPTMLDTKMQFSKMEQKLLKWILKEKYTRSHKKGVIWKDKCSRQILRQADQRKGKKRPKFKN